MEYHSLLLAVLATTSSLSTQAEPTWYIGGAAGNANISSSESDLDATLAKQGITTQSSMKCDCTAFKLFAGHTFNNYFAIEGGYTDLGKIEASGTFTAPFPGGVFTHDIRATAITLDAIGSFSPLENLSLYARLGMVRAKVTANMKATATNQLYTLTASEEETTYRAHYGLGLSYSLSPQWSIRGEWEHFNNLGDPDTTGQGDIELYSGGISYFF